MYHPYLAGWKGDVSQGFSYPKSKNEIFESLEKSIMKVKLMSSFQRSNLREFFSILQAVFQREPPVVAKQDLHLRPPQDLQPNGVPPPIPPLPPELERSDSSARHSQPSAGQQPPPPPPKPFGAQNRVNAQTETPLPPPHSTSMDARYDSPRPVYKNGYSRAPQPMLGQSPQRNRSLQDDGYANTTGQNVQKNMYQHPRQEHASPFSAGNEYRTQTSFPKAAFTNQQQLFSQQSQPLQPDVYPMNINLPSSQTYPLQPPYQNIHQQPPTQQHSQPQHPQQQTRKPDLPEDLLTSPFETPLPAQHTNVAPPPIPPNPQKDALLSALSHTLTKQIHSTYNSNLSALPPLRAQQAALTSTINAVNDEMSRLNDLEALLCANESILHKAMRDADKVLEDAKRRKVPNVDDVLVAPTVVAGQLYRLVAEQRAIEESRGVLGKALDKGRIGGLVWAKVDMYGHEV